MRTKSWLLLPTALVALAIFVPAGPAGADTNSFGRCPDGYTPTPFVLAQEEDDNGNGVVCIKFVDMHMNTHDDPEGQPYQCNGFPTAPPGCSPGNIALILDDLT